MERKIITTLDGSTTIQLVDWGECYHSVNGAVQEALHVFIKNGLLQQSKRNVAILEIGFGTGLNAFVTYLEGDKNGFEIDYVGVEAYPVEEEEAFAMNYADTLGKLEQEDVFKRMHQCSWEIKHKISDAFFLTKKQQFFQDIIIVINLILFTLTRSVINTNLNFGAPKFSQKCLLHYKKKVY